MKYDMPTALALIEDKVQRLLHDDLPLLGRNYKLVETEKAGFHVVGANLSPAKEHVPFGGQRPPCAWATNCQFACLNKSGRNNMPDHVLTRVAKTLFLERYPVEFHAKVDAELRREMFRASRRGFRLAARMNLLSDRLKMANPVARRHPTVQFNDYTASPVELPGPDNMYRTYSRKETWTLEQVTGLVQRGLNVSVVFDVKRKAPLPTEWHGMRVIDGDLHDARWTDPAGVIVGLRLKGTKPSMQNARNSGFAVALED